MCSFISQGFFFLSFKLPLLSQRSVRVLRHFESPERRRPHCQPKRLHRALQRPPFPPPLCLPLSLGGGFDRDCCDLGFSMGPAKIFFAKDNSKVGLLPTVTPGHRRATGDDDDDDDVHRCQVLVPGPPVVLAERWGETLRLKHYAFMPPPRRRAPFTSKASARRAQARNMGEDRAQT